MRPRTFARACAEALEPRMHLSVTAIQKGSTLTITGDSENQVVTIMDDYLPPNSVATRVTIDANGNGSLDDPQDISQSYTGIRRFILKMGGGDDNVHYGLDTFVSIQKMLDVDLGSGNNTFGFGFGLSQTMTRSRVIINLSSGSGNDTVGLGTNDLKDHSAVDVRMNLGGGNDTLNTNHFGDVANGSMLRVMANLGDGQDTFRSNIDYESFDILGGETILDIQGGSGNDTFAISAGNAEMGSAAQMGGLFRMNLNGGSGDDAISVNLPSANFMGRVYLHENGGSGNDTLSTTLIAQEGSNPRLDIALSGGAGDDVLSANVSGGGSYGTRHGVLLDGGAGHNTSTTDGDAPFIVRRA